MSRKRKYWLSGIAALILLWVSASLSPELTVRKYILTELQPIHAIRSDIRATGRVDSRYGYLYDATLFKDKSTGNDLGAFYLKKRGPFWYVAGAGSAP